MKRKNVWILVVAAVWLALAVWSWCRPADEVSASERRKLAQMPAVTAQTLLDGSFAEDFESYTQDQFPMREQFRMLKANLSLYALQQLDNNGIYVSDGYAAKMIYPLREEQVSAAAAKITSLYETYFADTDAKVYLAAIPDKGYFLAGQGGYLTLDFDRMTTVLRENTPWAEYIDLTDTLSLESYYRTDTHWRQEALLPTAQTIADALGADIAADYETITVDAPFYGVYYGQAALPLQPDTLQYLTSETTQACVVTNYETGATGAVYDLEKLAGDDPYDVFLSGAAPLLTVENPLQDNGRELVVFRDSFGSSLVPLLLEGYEKVTIVDTRYMMPAFIGQFVEFSNDCDVLFLYSSLLLNESNVLR